MFSSILSAGAASSVLAGNVINVTYTQMYNIVAPLGLIQQNAVVSGQWYFITDATQANGGKGGVYVQGITQNTISQFGVWQFDTSLKSYGYIDFGGTMIAGDTLNTFTVNGVSIITSAIAFATTYNQLAIDAATNINANGASNYTALAIQNRVQIIDKTPQTATNGFVIAATGTNYVTLSSAVLANGQNVSTIQLAANYSIVDNQILYAYDAQYNTKYFITINKIIALGLNPIYNFPFRLNAGFGGANSFINCTFNGQDFNNFFFQLGSFVETTFEEGCNLRIGSGCSVTNIFMEYSQFIKCTIDLRSSTGHYTGFNGWNISRAIYWNDSFVQIFNCVCSGGTIGFGRNLNDARILLTNSTLRLTTGFTFSVGYLGRVTLNNVTYSTGGIVIFTEGSLIMNLSNSTYSSIITVNYYSGRSFTFDSQNSSISGNITLNVEASNSNISFTSATITGAISITGKLLNSTIDFTNCTSAGFTIDNCTLQDFVINGLGQNFGATSILFTDCYLNSNTVNIPLTASNFVLTGFNWVQKVITVAATKVGINGAANNGLVNSDIVMTAIPPNFITVDRQFDFETLIGVGSELEGRFQVAGIANALMVQTAVAVLNNTTQGSTTAIIPAISGNRTNTKTGIAWDNVVIIPRLANLTAGTLRVFIMGYLQ